MLGNDLLEGEKVRLTALHKTDLPQFVEWFANIEFRRNLGGIAMPFRPEDEDAWFEAQRKAEDTCNFAIRLLEGNRLIGSCGVFNVHWLARNCMVGIGVGDPAYWGKGYGTDAMRVLLKFAFMEMDMHRVGLEVFSYNLRAKKSYLKIGFRQECVSREAIWRDGRYYDAIQMGILRREWETLYLPGGDDAG